MSKLQQFEIDLIFSEYEYGDLNLLSKKLNKSIHAIQEWARKRGLKRKVSTKRKGKLSNLLDGSLLSFYFLGFFAADGYISKNGHFMLSQKHKEDIEPLANFLETEVKTIKKSPGYNNFYHMNYRVAIYDKRVGQQINFMFGIQDKKTYTEIKLDFIKSSEQAMAFLIGYIDGDGSITKYRIRCQSHKNWFNVYKILHTKLDNSICNEIVLYLEYKNQQKDDFATLRIKSKGCKILKQFALENNLPIFQRKWSNILL